MLLVNPPFIKAINKMAKVKSMLNIGVEYNVKYVNIGVIKICSHMGTTLHKRLSLGRNWLLVKNRERVFMKTK